MAFTKPTCVMFAGTIVLFAASFPLAAAMSGPEFKKLCLGSNMGNGNQCACMAGRFDKGLSGAVEAAIIAEISGDELVDSSERSENIGQKVKRTVRSVKKACNIGSSG